MRKIYYFLVVLLCSVILSAGEVQSFIIVDYAGSKEELISKKMQSQTLLEQMKKQISGKKVLTGDSHIQKVGKLYILSVGPYQRDDTLAWLFLSFKKRFPNAMILDKEVSVPNKKPVVKTKNIVKTVYKETIVEKEDTTLWIAIFGLALIGILYMFLSSDTLNRLRTEYEEIKKRHKRLEEKQQEVLASIGDSIHTIAKETMTQTNALVEKSKDTHLYQDMVKVAYSENELLDVTSDLIRFLRLKSKKVTIHHERFDINNVLSEISGQLYNTFGQDGTELIFDIDTTIPRYMFSDSTQMSQILTNLLEYFIKNSSRKQVVLAITIDKHLTNDAQLRFKIKSDVLIDNEETLFESHYDEESRKYIGLGLFVAKELTYLMNGTLAVKQDKIRKESELDIVLPVKIEPSERRKYHFTTELLSYQKALIIDDDTSVVAIEKLFRYFKIETVVSHVKEIKKGLVDFNQYDIIVIRNSILTPTCIESLLAVKRRKHLKVISLESLFISEEAIKSRVIDSNMKTPLTQEYIFDVLTELYQKKYTKKSDLLSPADKEKSKMLVHRDPFPRLGGITIDSFSSFSGYHILIVEDNVINQKVLLTMLGKSDMKLSIANNGQEALDFIKKKDTSVDFVLMDINMPIMDGNQATEILKSTEETCRIPVVALSALNSDYEVEKMFAAGVNGYLSKPVYVDTLYVAFDTFLEAKDIPVKDQGIFDYTVFEASGLDIGSALEYMNQDEILYRELLKAFLDAYEESDSQLQEMLRYQNFEKIRMFCLDMKGLTGTIGAKNMHSIVDKIHRRILQKKYKLLASYVDRYRIELHSLTRVIKQYLET